MFRDLEHRIGKPHIHIKEFLEEIEYEGEAISIEMMRENLSDWKKNELSDQRKMLRLKQSFLN